MRLVKNLLVLCFPFILTANQQILIRHEFLVFLPLALTLLRSGPLQHVLSWSEGSVHGFEACAEGSVIEVARSGSDGGRIGGWIIRHSGRVLLLIPVQNNLGAIEARSSSIWARNIISDLLGPVLWAQEGKFEARYIQAVPNLDLVHSTLIIGEVEFECSNPLHLETIANPSHSSHVLQLEVFKTFFLT